MNNQNKNTKTNEGILLRVRKGYLNYLEKHLNNKGIIYETVKTNRVTVDLRIYTDREDLLKTTKKADKEFDINHPKKETNPSETKLVQFEKKALSCVSKYLDKKGISYEIVKTNRVTVVLRVHAEDPLKVVGTAINEHNARVARKKEREEARSKENIANFYRIQGFTEEEIEARMKWHKSGLFF